MGNFKCCPECGSEQITDEQHGGSYLIVCRECGFAVGPYALLWKAIEKWNGIERSAVMPEPVPEPTPEPAPEPTPDPAPESGSLSSVLQDAINGFSAEVAEMRKALQASNIRNIIRDDVPPEKSADDVLAELIHPTINKGGK